MQKTQNAAILASLTALLAIGAGNLWAAAPGGVKGYCAWGSPHSQKIAGGKGVSVFCVQQPDSAGEALYWKISGDSLRDIVMTNKRKANLTDCEYINFGGVDTRQKQINTYHNGRIEGKNLQLRFDKGGTPVPVNRQGNSGEVVVYNRVLNSVERLKVETYLALHHDVTLQNNYLASDNSLVWNHTALEEYSHNISGIARDDSSALQKDTLQSTALTLRSNRPLDNLDFVLVGDNGGNLCFGNDTATVSLEREWKASVTFDTISVDVRLDNSQLAELLDQTAIESFRLDVNGTPYTADEAGYFRNVTLKKGVNSLSVTADGNKLRRATDGSIFANMEVYPNPTTDGNVRIRILMPEEMGLTVKLYDANGRFIGQRNDLAGTFHDVTLNLPYNGIFMVQLCTLKETKNLSIIRK